MSEKRKISVRRILQLFVTMVVTVCCVIAMVSASKMEDNKKVRKIEVHIKNDKKYHFIEQQEILDIAIKHQQTDRELTPVAKLDIHGMEELIKSDPWVASAQVYIDNDQVLQMYVTQRIPVARVFDRSGRTYYLDTTLSIMPISSNYIYYTTMITNMPDMNNDSISWAVRKDVVRLIRTLQADTFWSAQVSQVIVDSAGMYELVPVLGDQRIIFGDLSRMKEKLNNLFAFYKNVLNRIGWDKYETLDLRFNGQVVAAPSLPYKGPTDRAVVTMNWINSIVETEARNDALNEAKDSVKSVSQAAVAAKTEKEKHDAASGRKADTRGKPVVLGAAQRKALAAAKKASQQKGKHVVVKQADTKKSKSAAAGNIKKSQQEKKIH